MLKSKLFFSKINKNIFTSNIKLSLLNTIPILHQLNAQGNQKTTVKHKKLDKKYPLTPPRSKRKILRIQDLYDERQKYLERLSLIKPKSPEEIKEDE